MPRLITERIKELRQEIAELTEANRRYLRDPKYGSAVADNERRFQRLFENCRRVEKPDRLEKAITEPGGWYFAAGEKHQVHPWRIDDC